MKTGPQGGNPVENSNETDIQAVLDFLFDEKNQPYWFSKSEAFDEEIRRRFGN